MNIDKAELAQRINSLEGLDNETKSQLLELLHERKRYGLVWEEKVEDVEERLRSELPVLREVKERALLSKDPEAPNHILIEGDNLEALTALSYTHEGKIDVIYIDPPYNTGNKDFVYNDKFVDAEDEYRHSKWLSFMAKRLKIAKRLLSDNGVIYISIDDNEQAALKLLCDEVFGERNMLASIVWQKIHSIKNDARYFSQSHEYVQVYAKNKDAVKINLLARTESMNGRYINKDNDPRGPWQSGDLVASGERNNGHFIIVSPKTGKEFDVPQGKHWVYSEENLRELVRTNSIWFGESGNSFPRKKRFLFEVQAGRTPNTLWLSDEVGNNQTATRELIDIFGERGKFDFPKPLVYIKQMLILGSSLNSTILDFFAGSGTTLHATMQLNAEDGGHRQCIMVTNNENNICEEVTYERNKRVINGYTTPKGEKVEGLHNNTLRYYKTDFVGRENTLQNRRKLVYLATDMLCIKEDCYNEQPCIDKQARLFTNNEKRLIILYNPDLIPELVTFIANLPEGEKIKVYVFADGAYPYTDDFSEVLDKIELCAIPDAILNAMRRVLPKKKVKELETIIPDKAMQEDIQHALDNATINDYKKTEIW